MIKTSSHIKPFKPLYTRNPSMGTLVNSKDPDEMPHDAASSGSTLFVKTNLIVIFRRKKIQF